MSNPPRLALATGNAHKVQEITHILAGLIPNFETVEILPQSLFLQKEPVEDGVTFEENALIKARALAEASGLPALADDSGLLVSVMGGAPGIFSARWAGGHGDDKENLALLLNQLEDVPDENRQAHFVCVAAVVMPDGTSYTAEGILKGRLAREPYGRGGFGYDPAFVPDGWTKTTAEVPEDEKNQISHRAEALRAIAPRLQELLKIPTG